MSEGIAIVGMGCRYPDARSPAELWDNVLARRRAFRLVPAERLRLEDYRGADPDSIYLQEAAVLAGWEFDRLRFKVAGRTFRTADLTHWLALEVAAAALADAGFEDGAGLPRDATGVLLGNTLTGEFARAQLLRQRWPYVRRTVGAELAADGWTEGRIADFLVRLEASYKAPFAAPCEETLAGGLSNTIAGRICNHFDLHGGGYVVDGACASSLLAVTQACTALAAGDLEVALAGGVDLSLDPFELVGFARTGALAAGDMRVYDARSSGFLPGEGCGFVVLMRERQAAAAGRRIHAVIRGWGISSDGHGGISRPEAAGQRLALARAYRRAGCDIGTVPLFEGHGTGTAVGDATELAALSQALREARAGQAAALPPAAIGSIKANIGHTKAAAGVAGLLKATQAVARGLLPPATGCDEPHPELAAAAGVPDSGPVLRVLAAAEPWPAGRPLRAGVSAMGFGGVNAHVMVEGTGTAPVRRRRLTARERRLTAPPQDVELVLLAGAGAAELAAAAHRIAAIAPRLSRAELGDFASELHRQWRKMQGGTAASAAAAVGTGGAAGGAETPGTGAEAWAAETPGASAEARAGAGQARAAIVAATPRQLAERAGLLSRWLEQGTRRRLDPRAGIYLGVAAAGEAPPAVGLLFTGQGSPAYAGGNGREARPGGALGRRFAELTVIYELAAGLAAGGDAAAGADTAVAQPAIVAHSLAGCWLLERLGVRASIAIGHSLGELTALCWAGACDAEAALRLAAARGRAMADKGEPGAMASLAAPAAVAAELLDGGEATIAAYNGASRTVVSGSVEAVAAVVERAAARGIAATRLKVARAFHSPRVAAAAADLDRALAAVAWQPLRRPVVSTVTGAPLAPDADPRTLLLAQLTSPVRFAGALAAARPFARLWIEVGPGRALAELAAEELGEPVVALDAGGPSLAGPLGAAAALFAAGLPVDLDCLFAGRFHRPFDLDRPLRFLANPCESAPLPAATVADESAAATVPSDPSASPRAQTWIASSGSAAPAAAAAPPAPGPLELVRGLVAARAELPASAVRDDSRLLGDLHLNSITVGQLVAEAARLLGLAPPASPTDYAHSTLAEVAQALAERIDLERASTAGAGAVPTGGAGSGDAGSAAGAASRGGGEAGGGAVPGVDTWVRPFTVALVERPLQRILAPGRSGPQAEAGAWRVIAPPGDPWAPAIAAALAALPESAGTAAAGAAPDVLLSLPAELDECQSAHLRLFVEAARAACGQPPARRFVVVQQGGGGGAFARTLHLELPAAATWVIDLPSGAGAAAAAAWVAAEVAAGGSPAPPAPYVEAHYDASGRRRVPLLRNLAARQAAAAGAPGGEAAAGVNGGGEAMAGAALAALAPGDVLLATGGGKGIGNEAAAGAPGDGGAMAGATLPALGRGDVLLATGGGKGIGAECALALARATGASLAILGRSDPRADPELAANLARMAAAGVEPLYLRADLADTPAVAAAVERAIVQLGPITGLLHAAGINVPRRLAALDEDGLRRALAPKVTGCRHLLEALGAGRRESLRLVVGFGSLIARTGLHGEAEYALANEWLARLLARHARLHPACRCLLVDWSVWSGTGMGERLGTLEALTRQGISPIPPDAGVAELLRLLADPGLRGEVVVTGRFGNPPALAVERPPLPLLRFLETPRVYYPGIELVVDAEVAADTDPYLSDHVLRGEPLFAAVLGLEAMAQAAAAVSGAGGTPELEQVELLRPVAVPPGRSTTLRLAALVREPGRVEVALRDRSTGFATDHFRAVCRFAPGAAAPEAAAAAVTGPVGAAPAAAPWPESAAAAAPGAVGAAARRGAPRSRATAASAPRLAIDPPRDLYGGILFQDGRFRRLGGYRRLLATECLAEIAADGAVGWFGRYLPPALLLGDPAARDAAIHAVQACIPHAQLLPVAVERILTGRIAAGEQLLVAARERQRHGDTFLYDLDILGADGSLRERWQGLRLRAVDRTRLPAVWSASLLAPYLERRLQELLPGSGLRLALEVAAGASPAGRRGDAGAAEGAAVAATPLPRRARPGRQQTAAVVERLVARGTAAPGERLHHRPDGRPEIPGGPRVSIAHAAGLVLAIAGDGPRSPLGCDLEAIAERPPATWRDLLGGERFALAELIAGRPGELPDAAATRVWTAAESLHKAGSPAGAPLLLETALDDGWLLLQSGNLRIASFAANLRELGGPCALAVVADAGGPA